jgi:hypothetical protein
VSRVASTTNNKLAFNKLYLGLARFYE